MKITVNLSEVGAPNQTEHFFVEQIKFSKFTVNSSELFLEHSYLKSITHLILWFNRPNWTESNTRSAKAQTLNSIHHAPLLGIPVSKKTCHCKVEITFSDGFLVQCSLVDKKESTEKINHVCLQIAATWTLECILIT